MPLREAEKLKPHFNQINHGAMFQTISFPSYTDMNVLNYYLPTMFATPL
jgi:hypothetical protein